MLRKIGMSALLLATSVTVCIDSFAMTPHEFTTSSVMEYELPANDPQVFINPTFWSITATCTIHTESPASVFIRGLNKSGKVNGIPIKKDDTLTIEIHDNDLLEIVADSAAKVELTNLSEETVKATCKA